MVSTEMPLVSESIRRKALTTRRHTMATSVTLIGSLPNAGLRWEKTATFEAGLDMSFFENRLTTNFTYYNRLTTSDKYANLSSTSTGFLCNQQQRGSYVSGS